MGRDKHEIILIGEKKEIKKKYYVAWPGDIAHEKNNPAKSSQGSPDLVSKPPGFTYTKEPVNPDKPNRIQYRDKSEWQTKKPIVKDASDPRPNSMKNRYFSSENQIQSSQEANNETTEEPEPDKTEEQSKEVTTKETPAFLERRDYLLNKLLKAHTLPGLEEEKSALKETSNSNIDQVPLQKVARKSAFMDDFIPLFGSTSTKRDKPDSSGEDEEPIKNDEKKSESSSSDDEIEILEENEYNPKVNTLDNYRGPYSVSCLIRARRTLIEEFLPNSAVTNRSNYFDRRFEILKMKLRIKSKFDKDNRHWNKMRRETALIKQELVEKALARDRRFQYFMNKSSKKTPYDSISTYQSKKVFNSDSDSDDVLFFDEKTAKYKSSDSKWKSSDAFIKLSDQKKSKRIQSINLDENSNGESGSNEEDVIKMINQQEYCLNTSGDENDSNELNGNSSSDEDSKCRQFGKYSLFSEPLLSKKPTKPTPKKKSKKNKNLNKPETNLNPKKSEKKKRATKKSEDAGFIDERIRIDRVGLVANDEYEELKLRYKTVRNKRNKALRKKKGLEIDMERKIMSDELKQIRNSMKKLRRKKKFMLDRTQMNAYNPLDMVRNKDSKQPKKKKVEAGKPSRSQKKKRLQSKKLTKTNKKSVNRFERI